MCVCIREVEKCMLHSSNETLTDWLTGKRQTDAYGCPNHPPCSNGCRSVRGHHLLQIIAAYVLLRQVTVWDWLPDSSSLHSRSTPQPRLFHVGRCGVKWAQPHHAVVHVNTLCICSLWTATTVKSDAHQRDICRCYVQNTMDNMQDSFFWKFSEHVLNTAERAVSLGFM